MSKERLLALEEEVKTELYRMAASERLNPPVGYIPHDPVTDGVVDEDRYLSSSPKMLWVLKEPHEPYDEKGGGGWSVTKNLIPEQIHKGTIGNIRTYAPMAKITFSVFSDYLEWKDIPSFADNPAVAESLRNIAYINVKKFPGRSTSYPPEIKRHYKRNQSLLKKQIETISPDIVIGGSTLGHFFGLLELMEDDFIKQRSVKHCTKAGRLYIDAFHPSQRGGNAWYVDDIVAVIKNYRQGKQV